MYVIVLPTEGRRYTSIATVTCLVMIKLQNHKYECKLSLF